ncbi:unnamed protein product [Pedinophyceae sp. YPF-701]|nr:unnamed protein product [Pedinophyceae sp. YPF-701]
MYASGGRGGRGLGRGRGHGRNGGDRDGGRSGNQGGRGSARDHFSKDDKADRAHRFLFAVTREDARPLHASSGPPRFVRALHDLATSGAPQAALNLLSDQSSSGLLRLAEALDVPGDGCLPATLGVLLALREAGAVGIGATAAGAGPVQVTLLRSCRFVDAARQLSHASVVPPPGGFLAVADPDGVRVGVPEAASLLLQGMMSSVQGAEGVLTSDKLAELVAAAEAMSGVVGAPDAGSGAALATRELETLVAMLERRSAEFTAALQRRDRAAQRAAQDADAVPARCNAGAAAADGGAPRPPVPRAFAALVAAEAGLKAGVRLSRDVARAARVAPLLLVTVLVACRAVGGVVAALEEVEDGGACGADVADGAREADVETALKEHNMAAEDPEETDGSHVVVGKAGRKALAALAKALAVLAVAILHEREHPAMVKSTSPGQCVSRAVASLLTRTATARCCPGAAGRAGSEACRHCHPTAQQEGAPAPRRTSPRGGVPAEAGVPQPPDAWERVDLLLKALTDPGSVWDKAGDAYAECVWAGPEKAGGQGGLLLGMASAVADALTTKRESLAEASTYWADKGWAWSAAVARDAEKDIDEGAVARQCGPYRLLDSYLEEALELAWRCPGAKKDRVPGRTNVRDEGREDSRRSGRVAASSARAAERTAARAAAAEQSTSQHHPRPKTGRKRAPTDDPAGIGGRSAGTSKKRARADGGQAPGGEGPALARSRDGGARAVEGGDGGGGGRGSDVEQHSDGAAGSPARQRGAGAGGDPQQRTPEAAGSGSGLRGDGVLTVRHDKEPNAVAVAARRISDDALSLDASLLRLFAVSHGLVTSKAAAVDVLAGDDDDGMVQLAARVRGALQSVSHGLRILGLADVHDPSEVATGLMWPHDASSPHEFVAKMAEVGGADPGAIVLAPRRLVPLRPADAEVIRAAEAGRRAGVAAICEQEEFNAATIKDSELRGEGFSGVVGDACVAPYAHPPFLSRPPPADVPVPGRSDVVLCSQTRAPHPADYAKRAESAEEANCRWFTRGRAKARPDGAAPARLTDEELADVWLPGLKLTKPLGRGDALVLPPGRPPWPAAWEDKEPGT